MSVFQSAKAVAKGHLSEEQIKRSRYLLSQMNRLRCWLFYRRDLTKVAAFYGTDKWYPHRYTQHYQNHFEPLRRKRLNILEIGIGGSEEAKAGAASLRMWKMYFPKAKIYGIDLYDKSIHQEHRIKTFCGSQADGTFLAKVAAEIGQIDIIIDDGSHYNEHVLTSFKILFPLLSDNGIYAIEDTQTSYWPEYGGTSEELDAQYTIIGLLKTLIDGLNYEEFRREVFTPTYFDRHIIALHFYHNLAFIYKGLNNENASVSEENIKQINA